MRRRGPARFITRQAGPGRRLRHTGGSGLNDLTPVVDMFAHAVAETPCMVPEPAPRLLKGSDVSALLVRRALRGESGRVLRSYEQAAVVCQVAALARRVAGIAPIVATVVWRIASSRVRGGTIVHRSHWLVLLNDLPRLAGPLSGRGDGEEGFAGGELLIWSGCWLTSRLVVGVLWVVITVAAFSIQAVLNACLDADVGAEVEWLVVVVRWLRHNYRS